jgi:hypothetical protein
MFHCVCLTFTIFGHWWLGHDPMIGSCILKMSKNSCNLKMGAWVKNLKLNLNLKLNFIRKMLGFFSLFDKLEIDTVTQLHTKSYRILRAQNMVIWKNCGSIVYIFKITFLRQLKKSLFLTKWSFLYCCTLHCLHGQYFKSWIAWHHKSYMIEI